MIYSSPLRYPGGKGKFADFFKLVFKKNDLLDGTYIEPYAGGASVAISLLLNQYAGKIIINDFDRSIYAFWHSVVFETEELCRKINDTEVSMKQWMRCKEIQGKKESADLLELGFSTFFLNRSNRSGIIKAGVIGGKDQTGRWKIDARFNKIDLIKRIRRIADYRNDIEILNMDACSLVDVLQGRNLFKPFFYLDPPYYVKGKELYVNHYKHNDHMEIASKISNIGDAKWIVSYDNHSEIKSLYGKFRTVEYSLNYSATYAKQGSEIMVFSNNLIIPNCNHPSDAIELPESNQGMLLELI